jgi:hypothetical protein
MTNWEKLLAHPDYTTDTGNREAGDIIVRAKLVLQSNMIKYLNVLMIKEFLL